MAFIDELNIHLKAGSGGDGVVRWRHEKGKEFSGPSGGNGGRGGNVYLEAISDITILQNYRGVKEFSAGNGVDGMRDSMHGKDGEDFVLKLPVGSVITNRETGEIFRLEQQGDKIQVLAGGRGGLGNEHFKSSVNTTPEESTEGVKGEEADFFIELELFADIGLVGFPNAGKSSLLNAITNAKAKIGAYAFTTLEPNLGALYEFIIADIPGLIEGAAEGKGLGHKFLRHIRRTKMLLHLISSENEDMMKAYKEVREELGNFDSEIIEKEEIIVVTKSDINDPEIIKQKIDQLKTLGKEILSISVIDDQSVKNFKDLLVKKLRK